MNLWVIKRKVPYPASKDSTPRLGSPIIIGSDLNAVKSSDILVAPTAPVERRRRGRRPNEQRNAYGAHSH